MRRALLLAVPVLALTACGGARHGAKPVTTATTTPATSIVRRPPVVKRLVPVPAGTMDAPIQDAAAAPFGGGAVLVGGLTPADVSSNQIVTATRAGSRRVGSIPQALHDAAAVTIGRSSYVFGGGIGVAQIDTILMVDPRTGAAQAVGHLPAPSSDQSATAIGRTAYVVGGYTGAHWLDTIVAWRPGGTARVVAHLPHTLRYAGVTAVGNRVIVAGGSLEAGSASSDVYEYVPSTGRVSRIGRLPAPTTHLAAATIGSVAYAIGGRGDSVGTPTARVVAIEPVTRRIHVVGALSRPLSDLAAVANAKGVLLAGGRDATATVSDLTQLVPSSKQRQIAAVHTKNVYAADRAGNLSAEAKLAKPLVYVPNSNSNTVDVIDQRTFKIVEHFAVGALPQHVVPAWDLKTLYVTNDEGNTL
ncbi:MAG: hypothetical protein QOF43_2181, partial [Gaiellaceae bacterium]|nr:hypothetical protein [Gaiellaceae bacterium]